MTTITRFSLLIICFFTLLTACVSDPKPSQTAQEVLDESAAKVEESMVDNEPKEQIDTTLEGFFATYENTNRVIWQKPELVIDMMGDLSDKTVADIGAGQGHFALRLAKKAKHVLAIDIEKRYNEYIDSVKIYELPEQYQEVLQTRLAAPDNPNIKPEELDIAIIVNTYMYIGDRIDWTKKVREGLKPGGKFIVIDFKRKRTPVGPKGAFRIPLYMVEEELLAAGFKNVQSNDAALDYQYIVVAEK